MGTTTAAVYCRISQDRTGAGLGVQRQRDVCAKWAAGRGMDVVAVHEDNDISAYSGKHRPGYEALLAGVQAGRFGSVIVWHADRLHRSPKELERYIDITEAAGVPTHSATGGELDLSTPSGRMTARIHGAIARGESEHKAERLKAKHAQSAQLGVWRGGARPFGYQPDQTAPGGLAIDPAEAFHVRDAYRRVIDGESLASIIRDWNGSGVQTTGKGNRWTYATLRQLLRRPSNYGASVHQGQVAGRGQWPPLVDEATFRQCCAVLDAPSRRKSNSTKGKHLMAGLLRCGKPTADGGVCGQPMRGATASTRNGGRILNYTCTSGDHYLSRQIDHVDRCVTSLVLDRLAQPDAADLLRPPVAPDDALQLQADLDALRERRDALKPLFLEGVLTAADLRIMSADLSGRIGALQARLTSPERVAALGDLIGADDPRAYWDGMTWRDRRRVIEALMTVTALPARPGAPRRFDPDSLRIDWK